MKIKIVKQRYKNIIRIKQQVISNLNSTKHKTPVTSTIKYTIYEKKHKKTQNTN